MRIFIFVLFLLLIHCGGGAFWAPSSVSAVNPLITRGETVYKSNCISCHNPDPSKNGSLGPILQGSSLELLQARVLRASYPDGYKPKRDSHLMPALPNLASEIEALYAYLNQ